MPCDSGIFITLVAGLEGDVQAQIDTAEADAGVVAIGVELAALAGLERDVIAVDVGDLVFGAAEEFDGVRLATAEAIVVQAVAGDLAVGQADATIVGGRRGQAGLATAGVERLLEGVVAGFIGRQAEHVTHLQVELALVTLVAVGAIGIACVRRGIALGTGEDVLAVLVLAVHQREQLVLQRRQFVGVRLAVGISERTVARAYRQFVDPLQDGADGVQGAFGRAQGVAHVDDVAAVLLQHVLLLLQLQQTRRPHRVILGRTHANAIACLLLALHRLGKVALVVGLVGVVELRSRDAYAHDLRLLKDC
ncbi:hypothetical protein D3C72_384010 [compost metagenome]